MAYYQSDRIERRNRRKAIALTTVIYGGLLAFFLVKDDIAWETYTPNFVLEFFDVMPESPTSEAVAVDEIRP